MPLLLGRLLDPLRVLPRYLGHWSVRVWARWCLQGRTLSAAAERSESGTSGGDSRSRFRRSLPGRLWCRQRRAPQPPPPSRGRPLLLRRSRRRRRLGLRRLLLRRSSLLVLLDVLSDGLPDSAQVLAGGAGQARPGVGLGQVQDGDGQRLARVLVRGRVVPAIVQKNSRLKLCSCTRECDGNSVQHILQ